MMTPEQQRKAIAEACGWRRYSPGDFNPTERWEYGPIAGRVVQTTHLPDYLNDLNAMHEAEKMLTPETRPEYLCQLFTTATKGLTGLYPVDENYLTNHATAAQRAEAFLKTLNLWED